MAPRAIGPGGTEPVEAIATATSSRASAARPISAVVAFPSPRYPHRLVRRLPLWSVGLGPR